MSLIQDYLNIPSLEELLNILPSLNNEEYEELCSKVIDAKSGEYIISSQEKGLIYYTKERFIESEHFFFRSWNERRDLFSLNYLILVNLKRHNIKNAFMYLDLFEKDAIEKKEKDLKPLCAHKIRYCLATDQKIPLRELSYYLLDESPTEIEFVSCLVQASLRLNDSYLICKSILLNSSVLELVGKQQKNAIEKLVKINLIITLSKIKDDSI